MFSGLGTLMAMSAFAATIIFILAIWSIVWKGIALWISAKEDAKYWFVGILVFNTAGIAEIIYVFFFSKAGKQYVHGLRKHRALKKAHKTKKQVITRKDKEEEEE